MNLEEFKKGVEINKIKLKETCINEPVKLTGKTLYELLDDKLKDFVDTGQCHEPMIIDCLWENTITSLYRLSEREYNNTKYMGSPNIKYEFKKIYKIKKFLMFEWKVIDYVRTTKKETIKINIDYLYNNINFAKEYLEEKGFRVEIGAILANDDGDDYRRMMFGENIYKTILKVYWNEEKEEQTNE